MTRALSDLCWPVRTERLQIRPATPADAEAVWTYRSDPQTHRWITSAPGDPETFTQRFTQPATLTKTLVVEHDGAVIGDLMVAVEDGWSQAEVRHAAQGVQAELGWCLSREVAGQGYATEAVRALLAVCFDGLGLRRVTANCFADNEASARLMRRVGMREEIRSTADSLHRNGQWLDGLGFALLETEWRGSR